jgi:hypothetical protein
MVQGIGKVRAARLQFLHQLTANSLASDTGSAAYRLAQNVKARKSKSV